jgi:hypothetical protein
MIIYRQASAEIDNDVKRLKEEGIVIDKKARDYFISTYPNAQFIGNGSFGAVFDIGSNRVVKITTDRAEIGFLKRKINHPFLVDIYDIKHFGRNAIIEMEKVVPLQGEWREAYDAAFDSLLELNLKYRKLKQTPEEYVDMVKGYYFMSSMELLKDTKYRRLPYSLYKMFRNPKYLKCLEFILMIRKNKIDNDAHTNNIGIRTRNDQEELVLFDARNNIWKK